MMESAYHMKANSYRIVMSRSRLHLWSGQELVSEEPLSSVARSVCYRVAAFADALGLSTRRLHQCFVRDIGHTPKEWMRSERMVAARQLLKEGHLIKDVSDELGFHSSRDFAREFLAYYEVSPTSFQRIKKAHALPVQLSRNEPASKPRRKSS